MDRRKYLTRGVLTLDEEQKRDKSSFTGPCERPVSTVQSQPGHLWLRDKSLEESDNRPESEVFPQDIVEDLEAALEQFREIRGPGRRKKLNPRRVDLCE
jgi:hypothetical protein